MSAKDTRITIYLDMDEVVTDFIGNACKYHGTSKEEVELHWDKGNWSIYKGLSKVKGKHIDEEEFWKPINGSVEFWQYMDWTDYGKEVIRLVEKVTDDWYIVSSPGKCTSSYIGKIYWLRQHLGNLFDRFYLTPYKHNLAKANTVLIDDSDSNCKKFHKHGGEAIILPRINNSKYEFRDDPVWYIEQQLKNFIR